MMNWKFSLPFAFFRNPLINLHVARFFGYSTANFKSRIKISCERLMFGKYSKVPCATSDSSFLNVIPERLATFITYLCMFWQYASYTYTAVNNTSSSTVEWLTLLHIFSFTSFVLSTWHMCFDMLENSKQWYCF